MIGDKLQNEKLDEWAEEFSNNVESWVEGLFGEY